VGETPRAKAGEEETKLNEGLETFPGPQTLGLYPKQEGGTTAY